MAKKYDQFEKFREVTLGGSNDLREAINGPSSTSKGLTEKTAPLPSPSSVAKTSRNAERKLVSFHIDKYIFHKLGQLKFELGTKYDILYNEAIEDLLKKYNKL